MKLRLLLVVAAALCSLPPPTSSAADHSEVTSLLLFKSGVFDPTLALAGWDPSTPSAPCDWHGVSCAASGRVIDLRLPSLSLYGTIPDLAFSNLTRLERLSLRSNSLSGPIPSSLSFLVQLRSLFLQFNSFSGAIPPGLFSNLTFLHVLNLSGNRLSGQLYEESLPSPDAGIVYLDLSLNSFSGSVPHALSNLSQLTLINLSHNLLDGEIPAPIGRLQKLEYLWLDGNSLEGTLPSAIANCSSLVHLRIEGNRLSGIVPATIGQLPKLQVVALSRNNFSGAVTSSLLCSTSIRIVRLGSNAVTDLIEPQANSACESMLEHLVFNSNGLKGGFPAWLTNASHLKSMDFSDNSLSGPLPNEIGKLALLEELRLANNSLSGDIPVMMRNCVSLTVIDLEGNGFMGDVPSFFGEFNGLKVLSLGRNMFSGTVPGNISSLTELEVFNLGGNALNGDFPVETMGLWNLIKMDLSGNRFIGREMPASIGNLRRLMVLNLSGCGFSGSIPASIGDLFLLTSLDLSNQNLSGAVPVEIAGLPNLQVIALQGNILSGEVPDGFCSLVGLSYLNLSANMFSGEIPATYGFLHSLSVLSLAKNRISGLIPTELGNCSNLQVFELRSNDLSGQIPADLSRLSRLKVLDLSRNNLTGVIPGTLSELSNLVSMDLSLNNLMGGIPANLSQIPGLVSFNVSGNNLQGEIPPVLGFRFNTSFAGNPGLCGKPLGNECDETKDRKMKRHAFLIAVIASGIVLLTVFCCFYVYRLLLWRHKLKVKASGEKKPSPGRSSSRVSGGRGSTDNGAPKLVMFNNRITLAETIEATRQFDEENVLSRTRFGLVFKACYNDGMVLSIRRLPDASLDENTFRKEAEALGKVKHRNLTVLRGFYAAPPYLRLLVYDYMPNGNLATLLQEASHQDGQVLNWPMCHLIVLGIARGLAFLHSSSIIHGDVKPQNVLFDADFEAHLSDFGLRSLMAPTPAGTSSSSAVGTLGYVSPEAVLAGEATLECDVYSFGIVLLELLTGKRPVLSAQDEDIVKWVKKQLQRGQITELLEPGLLELDPESSELEEFLLGIKVGLLCTAPDPLARPTMQDAVFMLEGCRAGHNIMSSVGSTFPHSSA